jgi:hypothetical protein
MGIISPKRRIGSSKVFIISLLVIFSPILILVVSLYLLWGAMLYIMIWMTWKKQLILFVYSNSPTWKDYMEREILPYIQERAVILNWSERKRWKNSLAVFAFRYFGGDRNFNPMALVFRPFRFVKACRFFEAFKDFKHGDPQKVEKIKAEFFEMIGVGHI